MKFENLFRPGRIGTLELKNRLVMPAMATLFCGEWGEVNDTIVNYYARRAKGGIGLVTVETTMAATTIDALRVLPRVLRADDDSFIPGLANLAEAVHENGAKIGIQLTPGGGCQASGGPWMPGSVEKIERVSPSGVPPYGTTYKPRVLSTEEVEKIVELYGDSALRIKRAGLDLIEIHGHGGYLIAQFLSPYFNKRTDKYGGSLDNRCRFLLELVDAVRKAVGRELALTVKYSIDEYIEGGIDVKTSQIIAQKLEAAGVDGISISAGLYGSKITAVPPYYFPRGTLLPLAEAIKEVVNIPVLAVGRLDEPELAEQVLKDGKADFIGLGRAVIADPDWPQKVASGQLDEIRKCIACNECREKLFQPAQVRCTINAVAGREGKYDVIRPADVKKKVVVVGGGLAGMEAARVAALRGHQVILFEQSEELGSTVKLVSKPPHKEIFRNIPEYYSTMLNRLGVELRLGKRATAELITSENPDAVIIATGAVATTPDIPGADKGITVTALDVLSDKAKIGKEIIIAGGDYVESEIANLLAQQNKKVTIVTMLDKPAPGMERWTWNALSAELAEAGVKILTSVKVDEITDDGIVLIDKNWNKTQLKADTVVLPLRLKPSDDLAQELTGKVKEVCTIGGAKSPGRICDAISEGYITAYNL